MAMVVSMETVIEPRVLAVVTDEARATELRMRAVRLIVWEGLDCTP